MLSARNARAADGPIRIGVIGCGGMGSRHLESLVANPRCEVVALCDVWKRRYERAAATVKKIRGITPAGYQDYRHVLDDPDVDAVYCATPDHWHALITIHACQAGKDVYVEKPVSTTIQEGRAMVDAARRYGRVVQVGTQQRSLSMFQEAADIVQRGDLGTITNAGAWVGLNPVTGPEVQEDPPEDLDWDLWLGPAPWAPYSRMRHLGFRVFHDYACGELTNWGVHLMDVVHWGLQEEHALSVQGVGGSYRRVSGADDFENVDLLYEFPGCTVTWEQRHSNDNHGKNYGMKFQGTKGRLIMDRGSFIVEPESLGIAEVFEQGDPWIDVASHHNNFFDCIRSRRRPAADIEQAHQATVTCLMGAIALDCQRKLYWDAATERFVDDAEADRHLFRPYRGPWHL
jgi:predicted dehydrogenase